MTPALAVENLVVESRTRHGVVRLIDDVSFQIAPGEILGVVGESGAGKSVTGTAVLGLLQPPARRAGGTIRLDGQRIDGLDERGLRALRGRRLAAVFQDPLTSLNPLLTIGRQLCQVIRTHLPLDGAAARARAVGLLESVGLPDPVARMRAWPHQLSGGMRQRVVLAMAFAAEPAVIVADEPTTALDVSVQAQIITLLRRLAEERGTAVMLITHDMGVIAEAAQRVAIMYAGRIVETGPTAAILAAPVHPYGRALMAAIPSLERRSGDQVQIEGSMPRPGRLPPGCSFQPRCPAVLARCRVERPALSAAGPGAVACWRGTGAGG